MSASQPPLPAPFTVSVAYDDGQAAVTPAGELDLASADDLAREVRELWSSGADPVVIDLRSLDFMDSSGLRSLLALRGTADDDARHLELRPGPPTVQRIFDLTGTEQLFRWR
ncbi:MAG: hypothetical protein AVDCRST_MAG38-2872 [uncultured Solirubrobacteraceae bacterium]|uniref:Anti-sigma factor antagonist n=1 Tax=uncultured Solirubrobacteraceae bacterium TaxID=1162706 RepID=A0A6J4SBT7_9ACTN|nr:MAG: hypothetical protein AVDCRST_MAG38-2872 [uncultured Solirubrobacteraceae bacterium]